MKQYQNYLQMMQAFQSLDLSRIKDDAIAMEEEWSGFTDTLCKNGDITQLQYNYCPGLEDFTEALGYDLDDKSDATRQNHYEADFEYLLKCVNTVVDVVVDVEPGVILVYPARSDGRPSCSHPYDGVEAISPLDWFYLLANEDHDEGVLKEIFGAYLQNFIDLANDWY